MAMSSKRRKPCRVNCRTFWAPGAARASAWADARRRRCAAAKARSMRSRLTSTKPSRSRGSCKIQSIPTVYAFFKGQPVDGDFRVPAQSEIKAIYRSAVIKQVAGEAPGEELPKAVAAADDMLRGRCPRPTLTLLLRFLGEDPNTPGAMWHVCVRTSRWSADQAEAHLNGAPMKISKAPSLKSSALHSCKRRDRRPGCGPGPSSAAVDATPTTWQARFDSAQALQAHGDTQAAVDQLLTLYGRTVSGMMAAAQNPSFSTFYDALKSDIPLR